jgi:starch synthase
VEARTLLPGYPQVMSKLETVEEVWYYNDLFGGPAWLRAATAAGLDLFVIDAPHLFQRPGNPYLGPDGRDWADNARRFAGLARVGAHIARGEIASFVPDVAHAHDWQAALTPAYLHYDGGARPGTVLTIHNLAFQGHFPAWMLGELGLPPQAMSLDGVEYFGGVGFLKAGLVFADRITTVSPTYAREIMTPEFGMALEGLLSTRASVVEGILNGIDDEVWNPDTDKTLAANFSLLRVDARAANAVALRERLGLAPRPDAPLFGVVSRLTEQKGLDLMLDALPALVAKGAQFAMLGSGDRDMQAGYAALAADNPESVGCVFGYDEGFAHLIQAGVDFLVVSAASPTPWSTPMKPR